MIISSEFSILYKADNPIVLLDSYQEGINPIADGMVRYKYLSLPQRQGDIINALIHLSPVVKTTI